MGCKKKLRTRDLQWRNWRYTASLSLRCVKESTLYQKHQDYVIDGQQNRYQLVFAIAVWASTKNNGSQNEKTRNDQKSPMFGQDKNFINAVFSKKEARWETKIFEQTGESYIKKRAKSDQKWLRFYDFAVNVDCGRERILKSCNENFSQFEGILSLLYIWIYVSWDNDVFSSSESFISVMREKI